MITIEHVLLGALLFTVGFALGANWNGRRQENVIASLRISNQMLRAELREMGKSNKDD